MSILSLFAACLRRLPGVRMLDRRLCRHYTGAFSKEPFDRGHYYSPLPNYDEVREHRTRLFNTSVTHLGGIHLRTCEQETLLRELSVYYPDFTVYADSGEVRRFTFAQENFREADAIVLQSMLRKFRPDRVIEVGSGYTSALMLDTNELFLDSAVDFTFVEPFTDLLRSRLSERDEQQVKIIAKKVQDVDVQEFASLKSGDILFIDSTHVSKIDSDVNFLVFEVLPALSSGVIIHFHDIIWPFEYLEEWVMKGIAWNEAYLLRAFLQYNRDFEILMFNSYAGCQFTQFLNAEMPLFLKDTGGSLWLRKT